MTELFPPKRRKMIVAPSSPLDARRPTGNRQRRGGCRVGAVVVGVLAVIAAACADSKPGRLAYPGRAPPSMAELDCVGSDGENSTTADRPSARSLPPIRTLRWRSSRQQDSSIWMTRPAYWRWCAATGRSTASATQPERYSWSPPTEDGGWTPSHGAASWKRRRPREPLDLHRAPYGHREAAISEPLRHVARPARRYARNRHPG